MLRVSLSETPSREPGSSNRHDRSSVGGLDTQKASRANICLPVSYQALLNTPLRSAPDQSVIQTKYEDDQIAELSSWDSILEENAGSTLARVDTVSNNQVLASRVLTGLTKLINPGS